ncbi:hypothetical protein ACFWYW_55480 [Nonomuraea sp. NPDC059023]|uniref:hypothetical protein n=1 Tax=unclassified Nonomuraea TaxID=2593643 RepID=UPI0036BAA387
MTADHDNDLPSWKQIGIEFAYFTALLIAGQQLFLRLTTGEWGGDGAPLWLALLSPVAGLAFAAVVIIAAGVAVELRRDRKEHEISRKTSHG